MYYLDDSACSFLGLPPVQGPGKGEGLFIELAKKANQNKQLTL